MWQTIEIVGRPADILEPAGSGPYEAALLFLHDDQDSRPRDSEMWTAELLRSGLPVVCPIVDGCWWLDTICHDFDADITPLRFLRESVVAAISDRWGVAPPQIGLGGIGRGGQGALQLAYRHARRFPVVAALSPAIDFHTRQDRDPVLNALFPNAEAARQQTVTLHLHPLDWPRHQLLLCDPQDADWFEGCERIASKLNSTGVPFEQDFETTRGGRRREYEQAQAGRMIRFLTEHLHMAG